jgi:hypothetical protein
MGKENLGCQRRLEDRKRLTQTMTFEDLGVDRTFVDFTSRPFCVLHVGSDPQRVMWRALGGRPYATGLARALRQRYAALRS